MFDSITAGTQNYQHKMDFIFDYNNQLEETVETLRGDKAWITEDLEREATEGDLYEIAEQEAMYSESGIIESEKRFNTEFSDFADGQYVEMFRTRCTFRHSITGDAPVSQGTYTFKEPMDILNGFNSYQEGHYTKVSRINNGIKVELSHPGGREAFNFIKVALPMF